MCVMFQPFGDSLKINEANLSHMTHKAHTLTRSSSKLFLKFWHYYINILNDRLF